MEEVTTQTEEKVYKIRAVVLNDKVMQFFNDEDMIDKTNSFIIGESKDAFAYLDYLTTDETGAYLWKVVNGKLTKRTESEKDADRDSSLRYTLRQRRNRECFPIINRGQPWYDRLTAEQKAELSEWYNAWLDVTETLVVPSEPEWLE